MQIVVRDGEIESQRPSGIVGYVDIPLREWAADWSFS
jgi:hypothetical protein